MPSSFFCNKNFLNSKTKFAWIVCSEISASNSGKIITREWLRNRLTDKNLSGEKKVINSERKSCAKLVGERQSCGIERAKQNAFWKWPSAWRKRESTPIKPSTQRYNCLDEEQMRWSFAHFVPGTWRVNWRASNGVVDLTWGRISMLQITTRVYGFAVI